MTKLGFARAVSAAAAAVAAPVAFAAGSASEPSFAITSTGAWSVVGVVIGSAALVWVMKKVS